MRRASVTIAAATMAALAPIAPAFADSTVTVHGTAFTDLTGQLSFVGCTDPFKRSPVESLQPYIGYGPGQAPAGERSLGYHLDPSGNAIGSLHYVASMTTTTVAQMSVYPTDGAAAGVAYAGYQSPSDAGTDRVWIGRTELSAAAEEWQVIDTAGSSYRWQKYDMDVGKPVGAAVRKTATIPAFVKGHGGDGPGFFTIGFGCDGQPFNMDAWRIGSPGDVTTYDLEGLETSISGGGMTIAAGDPATLHGAVADSDSGEELADAKLVLEAQKGADWVPVQDCTGASCTVHPKTTTTYRWRFDGMPRAEANTSEPFTVTVRKAPAEQPASSDPSPSKQPSASAKPSPSKTPSPSKSPTPSKTPKPSSKPTAKSSPSVKASPSSSPSLAAPSATQTSSPDPSSTTTTSPAG